MRPRPRILSKAIHAIGCLAAWAAFCVYVAPVVPMAAQEGEKPAAQAGEKSANVQSAGFRDESERPPTQRRRTPQRSAADRKAAGEATEESGVDLTPPTLPMSSGAAALAKKRTRDILVKPLAIQNCQVKLSEMIHVPTEIAGKLARVNVREGALVKKGDVLAVLDETTAKLEKELKERSVSNDAPLLTAQKRIEFYRREYDTAKGLMKTGGTSQEDAERNRVQMEIAQHEWQDAQVKRLQADIELEKAEEALVRHTIVSPVNGMVVNRLKHAGEAVQALEPIFHVLRTDRAKIVGQVDASMVERLRIGDVVEVVPDRVGPEEWSHTDSSDVLCVRVLPGDRRIAYGCADGRVVVVDLTTGRVEREIQTSSKEVRALVVCGAEPQLLMSAGDDGAVHCWSLRDGSAVRPSQKPAPPFESPMLALAVDQNRVTVGWTGHADGRIHAWDFSAGKVLKTFSGASDKKAHINQVTSLALSPDGKLLLSAGNDALRVWKADSGELVGTYSGRRSPPNMEVKQVNFSPDAAEIAFNSDGLLQFRSVATGLPVDEVEGGRHFAYLAMFTPIRGFVVAGREGGELQLWRRSEDGRPARLSRTFSADRDGAAVAGVDFAADGSLICVVSERTVRIHRLPSVQILDGERSAARITYVSPQAGASGAFEFHAELDNRSQAIRGNTTAAVVVYPE